MIQAHAENTRFDNINLPNVQLPQFSRRYEDYPGFTDQFRATIHNNSHLSGRKKLTYLRSCL